MTNTSAQKLNGPIPFYAEPYYNYKPLKITIGRYKNELLTPDTAALLQLAEKIHADLKNTDVESLFFLSIRLYDLGKKDEAFYWFHVAKSRGIVLTEMLDPDKIGSMGSEAFELYQLFGSITQLAGEYLNGYGFNDLDKAMAAFEKVKGEIKDIQSFKPLYKTIHFIDDKYLDAVKLKMESNLAETIDYIKTHKEEIRNQRLQNGIQDKY